MDRYLETIYEYQELMNKIIERINSNQGKSQTKLEELDRKREEQKEIENNIESTKNNIELLKKYEGKNLFWDGIKRFFKLAVVKFREYSYFDKLLLPFCFIAVTALFLNTYPKALILFYGFFTMLPIVVSLMLRHDIEKLRKSTSIESEEEKLSSLESLATLTKEQIKSLTEEIDLIHQKILNLIEERKKLLVDMQNISNKRDKMLISLVSDEAINKRFTEDEEIHNILKRRKEIK